MDVQYRFDKADVILALDADFLAQGPGHVRHAREFSNRRRVRAEADAAGTPGMNRLYVVESTPSITGAVADHRWPLRSSDVARFARALAGRLAGTLGLGDLPQLEPPSGVRAEWLDALAADSAATSRTLPDRAGRIAACGSARSGPRSESPSGQPGPDADLHGIGPRQSAQCAAALGEPGGRHGGRAGGRAAHPGRQSHTHGRADLRFAERMDRVPFRVHLGTHEDETSAVCHWHIPEAHYLETWGDVRSPDGTVSIVQPLIAPLFNGKSALEMLALLTDNAPPSSRELVTEFWRQRLGFANTQAGSGFDNWWRQDAA